MDFLYLWLLITLLYLDFLYLFILVFYFPIFSFFLKLFFISFSIRSIHSIRSIRSIRLIFNRGLILDFFQIFFFSVCQQKNSLIRNSRLVKPSDEFFIIYHEIGNIYSLSPFFHILYSTFLPSSLKNDQMANIWFTFSILIESFIKKGGLPLRTISLDRRVCSAWSPTSFSLQILG